jgi:hypothetical protein
LVPILIRDWAAIFDVDLKLEMTNIECYSPIPVPGPFKQQLNSTANSNISTMRDYLRNAATVATPTARRQPRELQAKPGLMDWGIQPRLHNQQTYH